MFSGAGHVRELCHHGHNAVGPDSPGLGRVQLLRQPGGDHVREGVEQDRPTGVNSYQPTCFLVCQTRTALNAPWMYKEELTAKVHNIVAYQLSRWNFV